MSITSDHFPSTVEYKRKTPNQHVINTKTLTVGRWRSIYLNKSRNGGKEIAGLKRGGVDGLKWGEGRESTRLAEGARKKKAEDGKMEVWATR